MTRPLAFAALTFVLTALTGALSVLFDVGSLPWVPGTALLAFVALVDPPLSAAITAATIGFMMDALSGSPLGLNVLACVATLIAGGLFVPWFPTVTRWRGALFASGVAALHASLVLVVVYLFQRRESFGGLAIAAAALANGAASLAIFPLARWVLVSLRLEGRGSSLEHRMPLGS